MVILDSHPIAQQNDSTTCFGAGRPIGYGHSLTTPNDGVSYKLTMAEWYLRETTGAAGTCNAKIYAHGGVFGVSSVPNGAALATSDIFDVVALGAAFARIEFDFTGAEQISLTPNTHYVITLEDINVDDNIIVGTDDTSGHAGNHSWTIAGWNAGGATDLIFYVHGIPPGGSKRLLVGVGK